ncbi:mitochondrial carrier domain-containing protein [Phycomyces nitens]|nr:mitochondrial carrier domain-containing protein [Phycomyces nitens]
MTSENLRNDHLLSNEHQASIFSSAKDSPGTQKLMSFLQANRTIVAASSAAITSVTAGFPFDSLKTRMQTHHYNSILSCLKITFAEEGARGFFRGMIPPLVTVSIIKSVSFSIYENTKARLKEQGIKGDTLSSTIGLSMLSGGASGAFIALLSCPLELVKIQRQLEYMAMKEQAALGVENGPVRSSSLYAAQQIVKRKGIFGLWTGVRLHSGRDTLGTSIYFGSYESAKFIISGGNSAASSPLTHFMAGGCCGILSWLVVFPVDLVKSVIQKDVLKSKVQSFRECASDIMRREGIRGLYKGLSITLIRAFPIHSLNFLVYEQVLRKIPPP